MEYLVVIPYRAQGAQGCELQLAIRGFRRHFKERHRIVVVGEDEPHAGEDCFVYSRRVEPREGQYRPHLDYVSCFRAVARRFANDDYPGFIWAADDGYAVNDFTIDFFSRRYANTKSFTGSPDDGNAWNRDRWNTRRLLDYIHRPHVNYTTHIPCWFTFRGLLDMFRIFAMDQWSYNIEDLYFNIYDDGRPVEFLDCATDSIRYGIWTSAPDWDAIAGALMTKTWICNSPEGWSARLEDLLKKHYGL